MSPDKDTTIDLYDTIADLLAECYAEGLAPRRPWLLQQIKSRFPHLDNPRLDLQIGQVLNRCVDLGILERTAGRAYAPGKRMGFNAS